MKITHCKLKRKIQLKLLEFFVLEVTARSASDLLGIQPNTAILFYRKIRQVIGYHLALQAHEVFEGKLNEMKVILAVLGKENEDVERQGKWLFSVC